jgi:CubicO group peptidase (beta-lactamase class C family)
MAPLRLVCILALLALSLGACSRATPGTLTIGREGRRLHADLERVRQQHACNALSVSVIHRQGPVWHADLGAADETTSYRLASVGKVLTALTLESLESRRVLDLGIPASGVLPSLADAVLPGYPPASLRDLLLHRSGLADRGGTFVAVLPPGLERQYWNPGYDLLAAAAETATGGTPFPDLVRREVAEPLHLEGLRACLSPETGLGIGSGGFCATRKDLERLTQHLLMREVSAPHGMGTLGFSVGLDRNGELQWLRQGGAAAGAGAELVLFPSRGVGVVILTDQRYLPPLFTDSWRALFRRLDLPRTDFRVPPPTPLPPTGLAGEYVSPLSGKSIMVAASPARQASLLLTDPTGSAKELSRLNGNRYAVRNDEPEDRLLEAMVRARAAGVAEFLTREGRVEGCLLDGEFYARRSSQGSDRREGQPREVRQDP